jgi:3-oxoacyl-[acyl-carrier-protein] synthase II
MLDTLIKSTFSNHQLKTKIDAIFLLYKNINCHEFPLANNTGSSFFDKSDQDSAHKIFSNNNILINKNQIHIIDNTCTTGLTLLTYASQGITAGLWKNVIVCTIDLIDPFVIYLLNALGALAQPGNDPSKSSRPFDVDRNGFVKTESGTIAIVSNNLTSLGDTALMKLVSFSQTNDAFRLTDGRDDCHYIKLAMQTAFDNSHLAAKDLAFIKTHGTGTKLNDRHEAKAIHDIFGDLNIPITSLKGHLGHTTDASGLIENLIAGYALKSGIILPTKNCDKPEFELNIVKNNFLTTTLKFFQSNSFGFGGNNASAIFEVI